MIGILISLLVLLIVFAVIWWVISLIPVPAEFNWIVRVLVAVVFLICLLTMLGGYWSFPFGHLR